LTQDAQKERRAETPNDILRFRRQNRRLEIVRVRKTNLEINGEPTADALLDYADDRFCVMVKNVEMADFVAAKERACYSAVEFPHVA
jgi:hypothetical protein